MAGMSKKTKDPSPLTVAQESMIVNFEAAAFDYPRESFAQITRRMLGQRGNHYAGHGPATIARILELWRNSK